MKLIISEDVRDDIEEIYNYIAKNSIKYANVHFVVYGKRNFKSFYKSYIKNNF